MKGMRGGYTGSEKRTQNEKGVKMVMKKNLIMFTRLKGKRQKTELQGEFKKIKSPSYDGEVEEGVEAWLINMNKCFQIYEYDENLKARLAIYQLQVKDTLWWEEVKTIGGIEEQEVTKE